MISKQQLEEFGWNDVPRNRTNVPSESQAKTAPAEVDYERIWPKTDVVKKAEECVKAKLPKETFNHSLRVYCYGHTIVTQHFPSWISTSKDTFFETWALTCLFHDIATTPENRNATHMSFEFQGGFIALQHLQSFGAPLPQAESVCEAIIRHQDPGETGTISRMGQLVQIATEFDNMGWQPWLVDKSVIEQVVKQHPRMK
ncbi:Cyanamide hydratase [Pseudocercospora fuligena]|uniref:Cyanamide hydratase n=1 Tax=Pseudocercospora fuligena TaxID=685502 RepID=A0A8H6RUS6_9PEZI|nr:Cyanamide hydratase [Pseudocercospora fuligena]